MNKNRCIHFILYTLLPHLVSLLLLSPATAGETVPANLFNIGDSIGEAEAANNVIGSHHHDKVWSTGYDRSDSVLSFNERFTDLCPSTYQPNDPNLDQHFNQAITGSEMSDFADQAAEVVAAAGNTEEGRAGMVAVYLGNNDVCSSTMAGMTSPEEFELHYRAGLDVLAASPATRSAVIHVSAIPAIYWLWEALRNNEWCLFAWQYVPCENLLDNPVNDCGTNDSHLDPDTIHPGDGPDCTRRKQIHAMIRDTYNPILNNVLQEYIQDGRLPNGYFTDVFGIRFREEHINTGDCFHPSVKGQAYLAQMEWERSPWGQSAPVCTESTPQPALPPWLYLLLFK